MTSNNKQTLLHKLLLEVGTGSPGDPELTGRDAERIYLNGAIPSTGSGQAWV